MIGFFDSGIGGLTVVREYLRRFPDAPFIYLGDTARTPYGNKSPETVTRYAIEDTQFLLDHGATEIVIACNSASAVATDALRKKFPSVSIHDVITPSVEDAVTATKGRVGVIGTRATILSKSYEDRIVETRHAVSLRVFSVACPLLVPLVEEGWLEDSETKRIVRRYLSSLRQKGVDTLIMGCTHYPLLVPIIRRFMGNAVRLIDPAASVVARLSSEQAKGDSSKQHYFLTDLSTRSEEIARAWLECPIRFEQAKLN